MNSFPRLGVLLVLLTATSWAAGASDQFQAKVLKVYSATDGLHRFRAYLVEWKGHKVIAEDPLVQTTAHADDLVTVLVSKLQYPQGKESYGLMHFSVMPSRGVLRAMPAARVTDVTEDRQRPPETANLHVTRVFAVVDDNYRYRAYVAEWEGQEIVACDTLVKVERAAGDTLPTLVMKHAFPQGRERYGLLHFAPIAEPGDFLSRILAWF